MTSVFEQRSQQNQETKKNPNGSIFAQRAEQQGTPQEPWWKDIIRTVYQIPSGIAQAVTYPMDLFSMASMGEALDPEGISLLQKAHEEAGIPFDEEKYREAVMQSLQYIPTQSNIENLIEEKTGAPLTPKTKLQKAIKLGSTAGKLSPGVMSQKAAAAVTAPAVSHGLQQVGVPEPISEIAGLVTSGFAGAKTPQASIGSKTKPSGLTERRFEKLETPKEVSGKKIKQINKKVENEFRNIASDIIEKSPIEETYSALKNDVAFKKQARESFKDVEALAEQIPDKFSTEVVKKELVDQALKKKGTGFTPSEYDKSHKKFIKEFLKETPKQDITVADLVTQYRKNNESLAQAYDPGHSFAYNRGKRNALSDYNKSISNVIEKQFPDSEFANLFKSTNKQWSQIMDAEAIDKFLDSLFSGKIKFEKGRNFFDKEGMTVPFKHALGQQGFKDFEQLMKDLMETEPAHRMMKVAEKKGFKDLAETGIAFVLHPTLGKAKLGYRSIKGGYKKLYEMLLDKPQFAVKWDKGVQAFKKGDFETANKVFDELRKESEAVKPSEILNAPKQTKKSVDDVEVSVKGETVAPVEKITPKSIEAPRKQIEQKELVTKPQVEKSVKKIEKPVEKKTKPKSEKSNKKLPESKLSIEDFETPEAAKKEIENLNKSLKAIDEGKKSEAFRSVLQRDKNKIEEILKEFESKIQTSQIQTKKNTVLSQNKINEIKRQDISKVGLKNQKNFILDKINDVLQHADKYAQQEKIVFDVPGDGVFKIHNNEKALRQFSKDVEKKWPDKAMRVSPKRKHFVYDSSHFK